MERFYSWRDLNHCPVQGTIEALVICYGSCVLTIDNVYRDIEEALKVRNTLPDCVYIIGSSNQYAVFKDAWQPSNNRWETMLRRGQKLGLDFVKQYVFLEWSTERFVKHVLGQTEEIYNLDSGRLLTQGVYSLLEKNNAIHQAPSGHVFKHPSGNKNNVFILAREIASDEAELFVVGYTIALKYATQLHAAKKVLIDTMSIYAYAKSALDLCGGRAEIQSFHSYDELEKLNPPSEPYFCIVSASTSGRMAKTMKDRQFAENLITTVVDVTSKNRCGDVMVSLEAMGKPFPSLAVSEGTLIEIIGENFTSKAKPPRPVIIGIPHTPATLSAFHKYLGFSVLPFNSETDGGRTNLLQVNAFQTLNHPDFIKWLDTEINWSFPLTVSHIIHANDDASQQLAEDIQARLKERLTASTIQLMPYENLSKPSCENATGVVVVSAVSRDGGVLREISRDLRSYIDSTIPRHFVTPVGIPQTHASWQQLKIFLTKNPTPRSYGFSNWIQIPIGNDSGQNTWTQLAELAAVAQGIDVNELKLEDKIAPYIVAPSLDMAAEVIDEAYNSFLKSPRGNPLTLSEGYLFFAKDSEIAQRYADVEQSVLYLTMSAVLQCAREHKDHTKRLSPTGYESVVLAPECFMRFNDAVLQACLLRASMPSELDYSASPELSKLMRELLSKIFTRCNQDFGDAALEFAASIAVGSLQLSHRDMQELFNEAFQKATQPSALLGLLIIAMQSQNR